jgi:hypothetical protein
MHAFRSVKNLYSVNHYKWRRYCGPDPLQILNLHGSDLHSINLLKEKHHGYESRRVKRGLV